MLNPLTLDEIAEVTGGAVVDGPNMVGASGEESVLSVSTDTRTISPGALFVALKGENFNGHDYVGAAETRGASALLVERTVETGLPYLVVPNTTHALGDIARLVRDGFDGPVIGVTGSVGKTTTKELLALVLAPAFNVQKSEANFNNEIGVPQTIFGLTNAHTALVVEMGMRGAKQIARLAEIADPQIGIVTGVGMSHIELLGSREAVADAKAELLSHLPNETGLAVFPLNDPFASVLREKAKCNILTVGVDDVSASKADVRASDLLQTQTGWRFSVTSPWGEQEMEIPSPGKFNVQNALLAVAVAGHLGIDLPEIAEALGKWSPPAMRLQVLQMQSGVTVISDAYNAAPDSVSGALHALRDTPAGESGKKIAILGEMRELGTYAEEGYRLVGRAVAQIAPDMLVLIGQAAQMIGASARVAGFPMANIHVFNTTADAASVVSAIVQKGDIVLVKGSRALGMEAIVEAMGPVTAQ